MPQRVHISEEVFASDYVPHTTEEKELFQQKQIFMYSVFDDKLQTDMGKHLVRAHESTSDAQKIFTLLHEYALKSTRADIESSQTLEYITSTRVGKSDSGWRGTTHSFILHWQNKVREYEEMVPSSNHFPEGTKLTMLQNAVSSIKELHQVKLQVAHNKARGMEPLSYDAYSNLLLSAASIYDLEFAVPKTRDRRNVYSHEAAHGYSYETFDIDTDVTTLMANVHDQRPRMKYDAWQLLTPEEKELWDGISDAAKAGILGSDNIRTQRKFDPKSKQRSANLHDLGPSNMHSFRIDDEDPHPENKDVVSPDASMEANPLLAYVTNRTPPKAANNSSPGDLRNVLSTTKKRYESSDSEITINGKTYREVTSEMGSVEKNNGYG